MALIVFECPYSYFYIFLIGYYKKNYYIKIIIFTKIKICYKFKNLNYLIHHSVFLYCNIIYNNPIKLINPNKLNGASLSHLSYKIPPIKAQVIIPNTLNIFARPVI